MENEKDKVSPCCVDLRPVPEMGCVPVVNTSTHAFKNGKYYRDGHYWGDVIAKQGNMVKVMCNNGHRYMQGQVITMEFVEA